MEEIENLIDFNGSYEELRQAISGTQGLVVEIFTAPWCPPCRKLCEMLPNLAKEYKNVMFIRTNTDEAHEIVSHYCIKSIPHIKFFKNVQGNQIQELVSINGLDISQIEAKLKQFGN